MKRDCQLFVLFTKVEIVGNGSIDDENEQSMLSLQKPMHCVLYSTAAQFKSNQENKIPTLKLKTFVPTLYQIVGFAIPKFSSSQQCNYRLCNKVH